MTIGAAVWTAARTQARRSPLRSSSPHGVADGTRSTVRVLRVGIEQGLVATVGIVAPMLVLQSLPAFAAERVSNSSLMALSLVLVIVPCLVLPLGSLGRHGLSRLTLPGAAVSFLLAAVLERFEITSPFPVSDTPWLIGVSAVAFSYLAIGFRGALRAGVGSAAVIVAVITAYAGRVPLIQLLVDTVGLSALAAGLIVGVTMLRHRADSADAAEQAARQAFERARRHVALEEERVRTDALLHDCVLNALLVTASGTEGPDRVVRMARTALEVVSGSDANRPARGGTLPFGAAAAAAQRELAAMRELVHLDLAPAHRVELPARVADTLVAAMLQAVSNSIKHAGPMTSRIVRATPIQGHGIRITVRDDGVGFDMSRIAAERLGVRVSIIERVRLAGGMAEVRSAPGSGTTVVLEWTPTSNTVARPMTAPDYR